MQNLPNLTKCLSRRNLKPVIVAVIGSSVGNGAGSKLPDKTAPHVHIINAIRKNHPILDKAGWVVHNRSIDGSVISEGYTALVNLVEVEGIKPDVLISIENMNDGETAHYNGGQAFTGFKAGLDNIITYSGTKGFDVILTTTPHPHIGRAGFVFPSGEPVYYPVPGGDPLPLSDDSVIEIPVEGSPGEYVLGSYRHADCNDYTRERAEGEPNVVLIDAEREYLNGVLKYGEDAFYSDNQYNHPSPWGIAQSYGKAAELHFASE